MDKSDFEKLFNLVPAMVCIAGSDGYFKYLNPAWERKLGYSLNELLSRSLFDFIHPDDHGSTHKEIEKQLKGKTTLVFTNRYRCKDGSYKILEWKSTAAEGNKLFAVAIDITEKQKKADALKKSENQLRSVLENLEMIAVSLDTEGNIIFCNDYLLHLTGWKREEVLGKNWFANFLPSEIRDEIKRLVFQKTIRTGKRPAHYQNEIVTKDGQRRIINWSNTVFSDSQGKIINVTSIGEDITKRIQAETDLKRSETRYRQIFQKNKAIKLIIDPDDGSIVEANEAACNFYGFSKKEILDLTIFDINVMQPEKTALEIQKALHEDQSLFFFSHRLASGEVRDVEVYSGPVIDGNKNMLYSIIQDVTSRNKAEQDLRKSETHLRSLVRTIPDLIWLKDQKGVYLSCNPRFEKFFGAKEKDIIGKTDYDFVDKKLADSFRMHDKIAMEKGQLSINEEEIIFADDGHHEIIETIKTPMYTDHGKLAGVLGIGRDITHRKHAEEALKKSHQRFLTLLNSIDANIYVADIQTHEILFMNKHMIDDFGRDMTGENCWTALRGESEPCSNCVNNQLIDGNGEPADVYIWQEKHPITGRWYINHTRAIEWTDGQLVRFQIATDITELRKIEDNLRQAHKMDALGTLAGGIAHDFNNILSAIIGYTELSFDDVEKGSYLEDNLKEIITAGMRAKDLVNQILAFARQSDEEFKPIRLDLIVKEVLKFLRSSIPTTIDLKQNIYSDSLILGDPTQIHEILMNLCSNAAYAMEDGSGILEVSLKDTIIDGTSDKTITGLHSGHYIELKVSDTGTGIPADIMQSIFEPYFTSKPIGEGTGMGLAVVHGIVKNHGGKINVDSKIGHGTTFTIYLPITKKRTNHSDKPPEILPTGTEHILFVDDESAITKMADMILKRLGYQVTIRTSSVEALELFQLKPYEFDLVISDLTMPNLTGDILAIEMMKIREDIPVIVCTGYSKKISDESAKEIGIKAFIKKPIVKSDLAKTIRNVLDFYKS